MMTSSVRKFVLTLHITSSVGWIGAVAAYLVLVLTAMNNQDTQILRASWMAMEFTGRLAIVPLALASFFTGLVMSLGTKWGLFRHYWVLISLILTAIAVIVLLQHMQTVIFFANIAVGKNNADFDMALHYGLSGELFHAGLGLIVLLVIEVLNIYKPRGMTPYGWRKQQEQRGVSLL